MNGLTPISAQDAARLSEAGALIVDIREADERAHAHIPGSAHAPLSKGARDLPKDRPIIFHCKSGMRTQANAAALCGCAGDEAYFMVGGIEAWKSANLPMTQSAGAPLPMFRQVLISAGLLILIFAGLALFVHPYFWAGAACIGAGLLFAGVTGFCGMAKILQLMPWNATAPGDQAHGPA